MDICGTKFFLFKGEFDVSILNIVQLFGGLAFFLFGMSQLSSSLEKMAGGSLEKLLKRVTDNPAKGFIVGMVVTIAIQSSSATTVMLVGFVNSGIMELIQTVSVIFGADVGTTLTTWILSLTGIKGGNVWMDLMKPKYFSMIFALIGTIMIMLAKKQRTKDIGTMAVGFCILMEGMTFMSDAMAPLADLPAFSKMMESFNNPLVGVLVGTLITGIIQSSAASIGILQGLSMTGQITMTMGIPIIMGANIGTCMTAILSCIGVNRKAKRVAAIHVAIKVVGTILWLIIFYGLNTFMHFSFLDKTASTFNIALFHTIFNVVNTAVLIWFQKFFVKLAMKLFPDEKEEQEIFLDERLMATPAIALSEVENSMTKMVDKAFNGLEASTEMLLDGFDADQFTYIQNNEHKIDDYEDHIGGYLMKLTTTQHLSEQDKKKATKILQGIGEFERLADHASYISKSCNEMAEKKIKFSEDAKKDEEKIIHACQEIYRMAVACYRSGNVDIARRIEPLQNVISVMCETYKENHVERLAAGTCTAEQGFIFNDILYSCERIGDHSMNIAAIVLRVSSINMDSRKYMHDIKLRKTPENEKLYEEYYSKYLN